MARGRAEERARIGFLLSPPYFPLSERNERRAPPRPLAVVAALAACGGSSSQRVGSMRTPRR